MSLPLPPHSADGQVEPSSSRSPCSNSERRPTDVSVIIPCYRSGKTIGQTLNSILAQDTTLRLEIMVVDSSRNGTAESIRTRFPGIGVLALPSRCPAGKARNLGASRTGGRLLAFIDADVVLTPQWLAYTYARLSASTKIRMVSAAVANGCDRIAASRILHWIEFSHYLPGLPSGFRCALSSSNLLVERHDFESAGGFDETMVMAEDLDLSRRFPKSLYFDGGTAVKHHSRQEWAEVRSHLGELGYWSGIHRLRYRVRGSWLRHLPFLSLGLPCLRLPRIASRVFQSSPRDGLNALVHLPLILVGLISWTRGFYSGIRAQQRRCP